MNKKLIAAAVSAAVVAPVASQAADVTVYGNVTNAIDINDSSGAEGAESTTDISGVSARLGVRASSDLGNGLTGHGAYEFATVPDKETDSSGSGIDDIRVATVGLSGGFGRIDVGNQWSAYFDTFGTLVSPTYTLGYYMYSSIGGGPYRASNTIKYSNTFGPVYAELDLRLNGSNENTDVAEKIKGDGFGLGLSFSVTPNITVGFALDSESGLDVDEVTLDDDGDVDTARLQDVDRMGLAVKGTFGGFWGSVGWQTADVGGYDQFSVTIDGTDYMEDASEGGEVTSTFLYVGGSLGEKTSWLLGSSMADYGDDADDDADDPSQTTWGIFHKLGGGMTLFYEGTTIEGAGYDGGRHLLGMRVNF